MRRKCRPGPRRCGYERGARSRHSTLDRRLIKLATLTCRAAPTYPDCLAELVGTSAFHPPTPKTAKAGRELPPRPTSVGQPDWQRVQVVSTIYLHGMTPG